MKHTLRNYLHLLLIPVCLLTGIRASASHVYGADFYYTWVSGNTYTVSLAIYGDCAGTSFYTLVNATPEVEVWNGSSLITYIYLSQVGSGVNVTPVCPSQASNTRCSNALSNIPGVMRYTYSLNYTVSTTSANWMFRFTGNHVTTSAGRSNSITNINNGSTVVLEARLNNLSASNSSVSYTTIPTPFFCINKAANYNPGAVDPNLDSLHFSLVTGLNSPGTVTYISPYTATAPLAVSTGSFSFSGINGQLAFIPNAAQRSLVVSQVEEYRNNVLVGTSMREMTFVVLSTCNNNPPGGTISNTSAGVSSVNSTSVATCGLQGLISFQINPVDSDGDHINMLVTGLPAGAAFSITGNGGYAPSGSFTWNVASVTPGTYNFFITFTDDGCPLSSKQSVAYTIIVSGSPRPGFSFISAATCAAKAKFSLTPSGGPSPYTVSITGGSVADTFRSVSSTVTDSVAAGTYTISTRSSIGCPFDTIITIASPSTLTLSGVTTNPACVGGSNGSITVTGANGLSPYTYAIGSGTFSSGNTFSGLSAGTYAFHVKDAGGCSQNSSFTIADPADIYAAANISRPTCNNLANGSVTLSGYNSISPYTYAIGTGTYGSSGIFGGLTAGSYTLHIRNNAGCIKDTVVMLTDSLKIAATFPVLNALCFGNANGAVTVNASGAISPYTYAVNTGAYSAANTIGGLAAGTYTIHVRDSVLCYFDTTVTITAPPLLKIAPTAASGATCNGGSNGAVTVAASGGTPGYTYSVDAGPYGASGTFTGLAAGSYTFHVKDTHNCISDTAITIAQPAPVAVTTAKTAVRCNGGSTGTVTVTASGGTPGYTYAADAGTYGAGNILTGLNAGTHIIHTKDVAGCIRDTTISITEPAPVAVGYTIVQPLCNGAANGTITMSASGGTTPYLYALNTGSFTAVTVYNGRSTGIYVLHIRDAAGCTIDSTITLAEPPPLTIALAVTHVLCNGDTSGTVLVTAAGGTMPYTYAANSRVFGTGNLLTGFAAGADTIHLKDANGCIKDSNITITQPTLLRLGYTSVRPLCNGDTSGSVTITATGGGTPYQYALNSGAFGTSGIFNNLGAGTYTLHLKDVNGCTKDSIVNLTQSSKLAFSVLVTNVLCNSGNTGTVTVTASGGTTPYQYASDAGPFGSGNTLTGFSAGTHVIHLKDANGCTKDSGVSITQPPVLGIGYTATQPLCNATSTGTVTISGTGGTTPYTYAVNTGSFGSAPLMSGLPAGTHMLHISDAKGCFKDSLITLGEPTAIILTAVVRRPLCTPLVNGYVWLYPSGGTPGYTYAVGSGTYGSSGQFNNLPSGSYIFHVRDANGCLKDTAISLQDSVFIHANYAVTNVTCYGGSDGTVAITPSGGDLPYRYSINTSAYSTSNPITNLSAGAYMLHVKDSNGCQLDTALSIIQPSQIIPGVVMKDPLCYGGKGSIQMTAIGGTAGYTYANGSGTYVSNTVFNNLATATYTLHVKDANNCIRDTTVTMGQPAPIVYDSLIITHVKCSGDNSGTVFVYSHGGTSPYTYARNNAAYGTGNLLTGFYAGINVVHIRDASGCIADTTASINEPMQLHFRMPDIKQPSCEGFKDGSIAIAAFGGTPQYLYAIAPEAFRPVNSYTGLGEGTYLIRVRDSNLCAYDTAITLTGNPHIVLGKPDITSPSCFGLSNGTINLNVSGGVPPLTYHSVSPDMTNNTGIFDTLRKGSYTFSITDAKGCRKDTTLTLTQPPLLTIASTATNNDCEGQDEGGQATAIADGGTAPYIYTWSSGQHTDVLRGAGTGTYRVTVTDARGCRDSSLAVVGYDDCCKPFIPDAFTPNGDGRNDVYRLRWKGDVNKLQFSIYNRFGERVFVSYQTDIGWDGTYHGKPCDVGTYFYLVRFICGSKEDNSVEFKGDVTLIR